MTHFVQEGPVANFKRDRTTWARGQYPLFSALTLCGDRLGASIAAAVWLALAPAAPAGAQTLTRGTLKMVVPFAPGGPSDVAGRIGRVAPRVAIDARRLRIRPCQQRHPCLEPGALQNAALQHAH